MTDEKRRLLIEYKKGPTTTDPYCPQPGWWCHIVHANIVVRWNAAVYSTFDEADWRRERFNDVDTLAFAERYHEPMTDERITSMVADFLIARGMTAASIQTGGWVYCVEIQHAGQVFVAGMANETWGAEGYPSLADYEEGGEGDDRLTIETSVPSDSHDITAIASALHDAIVNAPIVRARL